MRWGISITGTAVPTPCACSAIVAFESYSSLIWSRVRCTSLEVRNRHAAEIPLQSGPYGQVFEQRPKTASLMVDPSPLNWRDQDWMAKREKADRLHAPLSIYEVHLGSRQRGWEGEVLDYRELGKRLVEYVLVMGSSHIELLPLTEHPYGPTRGCQATGYCAPTSRVGSPEDFRWFVD